ncbi:MAG TPA: hypothetical protein GXX16_12910 [Epulopiscium sp.]|nr:hypothetical protein [Candidatus Epulonipiscium sp.]
MRKIMSLMISLVMFFSIPACGDNIKNINVIDVESKIYTEDDIHSAIQIILEEFNKSWNGCTLKEIYYAGDETCQDYQDWADRNGADEAIVLLSSFDVDSSGGNGSLNPNSTYEGWNWILVRSRGGQWRHVDHGY